MDVSNSVNSSTTQSIKLYDKDTALHKYWKHGCFLSWFIFIVYQLFIYLDHSYSKSPLCPYNDDNYGKIYWYSNFTVLGAFIGTCIVVLLKLFFLKTRYNNVPFIVSSNIVIMSTLTTLLSVCFNWGGVCIDKLNVSSPAAIWGEWMSSGPLLIFLTISIDNKTTFSYKDWILIYSSFFCILFGFLIIPRDQPLESARFFLFMSFFTYIPILYLPYYTFDDIKVFNYDDESEKHISENINLITKKRKKLSLSMCIILSNFCINYLLAVFGAIDYSTTIIVYQILTYTVKGVFIFIIMDIHIDLYSVLNIILDKHIENSRKNFMKYVFHEVRTPLNSIVIGIDLISDSLNNDIYDKHVLEMMKISSNAMTETLDNLIRVEKIKDKKIEFKMIPMCLDTSIQNVITDLQNAINKKSLNIIRKISPNTPDFVLGDVEGIENVLSNIMSNAIKYSDENKSIFIVVDSIEKIEENIADITISITDEGMGISEENQKKLFNRVIHVRPLMLQTDNERGIGLFFCKNIVEMHGGTIVVNSKPGRGTQFKINIPFAVVNLNKSYNGHPIAPPSTPSKTPSNTSSSQTPSHTSSGSGGAGAKKIMPQNIDLLSSKKGAAASMSALPSHNQPYNQDIKVLIVDDSEITCKMEYMLLNKLGILSQYVENGKIAVDTVSQNVEHFQLILMDNLMPMMNGVVAAKTMRTNGYNNLIIGVTGNVLKKDKEEFIREGADMVLSKPLKMDTMNILIKYIENNGFTSKYKNSMYLDFVEKNGVKTLEWNMKGAFSDDIESIV